MRDIDRGDGFIDTQVTNLDWEIRRERSIVHMGCRYEGPRRWNQTSREKWPLDLNKPLASSPGTAVSPLFAWMIGRMG